MARTTAADRDAAPVDLDEIVGEFLLESHEALDRMDQDLLVLEREPDSAEAIARVFRAMHTIKGTCGFLGFAKTEAVAHAAETLLGKLRDRQFPVTPTIVTALLSSGDAVRQTLGEIQQTGAEGRRDHRRVIQALVRLSGPPSRRPSAARAPRATPRRTTRKTPGKPQAPRTRIAPSPPSPPEIPDKNGGASVGTHTVGDSAIRVDVGLLDGLMTLVGELVLARNQIIEGTAIQRDPMLSTTAQRLDSITTELQEGIMRTRMQPIGTLWVKYPRLVRDLAIACGKQARIKTEGEDTELDRSLIEAVRDPLTHLVRNAVDHGVERPAERKKAGKPVEGVVSVRSFHEGGQVVVEVTDDGAGIDPQRLLAKAIRSGLVTAEAAAGMSEREVLNLIFVPGFSLAERLTKVSGRGVGMDVVRANIESVGGTIDVQSTVGAGTTFNLKIPLTLAIIPALLVTAAGGRYAIPQVSLLELVRIEPEDVPRLIETIQGAPVYRLRGRLLPLVDLVSELGEHRARTSGGGAGDGSEDRPVNIVVLQADGRRFGLMVDGISDSAEIVVKPVGRDLKDIGVFAGATIMGDGRVGLILDVIGLAQRAHVVGEVRDRGVVDQPDDRQAPEEDGTTLLLFSDASGGRMAIALDLVDRLEEFQTSALERSGPDTVVQYRDEILPLVDVSGLLPEHRRTRRGGGDERLRSDSGVPIDQPTIQVVVHRREGYRIGVVVERIIDIVQSRMDLQPASRPGVAGTLVINGRVTEVLDLPGLLGVRDDALGVTAAWA